MKHIILSISMLAMSLFSAMAQETHVSIVAHRGFWNCDQAGYSQNSIASLRCAQEHGFWGSEFDVQLTSDDVIIVNHDDKIDGVLIWDHPYSAFADFRLPNGEKVSTLDEYLAQGERCSTTMLVLEFKKQASADREDVMVDKTIEALKAHGLYDPSRVMFISFSWHICCRVAELCPGFGVEYLNGEKSPKSCKEAGLTGIDYMFIVYGAHPMWISKAHKLGINVNVWTVNSDSQMRRFIKAGADVITTNEPLSLRSILGYRERKIEK